MAATEGQQHPLRIYYIMWIALFVLSFFSYMVDYLNVQGNLRWFLILLFMFLKAGGIIAVFMHMKWERLSLKFAILGPPVAILVLIGLMASEGHYVENNRVDNYGESTFVPESPNHEAKHAE